jgi:signal transduction histidine kinase
MNVTRPKRPWSRRVLLLVGLGVGIPAALLVALGIYLTLRVARAIESESARYNAYMGRQVEESYRLELLYALRESAQLAEIAARSGAGPDAIVAAMRPTSPEFLRAEFVPLEELWRYNGDSVQGQPIVFGTAEDTTTWYVGLIIRNSVGDFIGAVGWWIHPDRFLRERLRTVVQERLPSSEGLYGDIESTRRLSVQLVGPGGQELARVRDPGQASTAKSEPLDKPFEPFSVRVSGTRSAPIALAARFVAVEVTFIGLMGMAIVVATLFGLRYILRQVELAQMKAGFVSNVTHELKTPIALIRLAVETLEMGRVRGPEDTAEFLGTISRETLRLEQLVNNILDFARLEAGRHIFRFEPVEVVPLVESAVETLKPRLEHGGFRVELDLPASLPQVRADRVALGHCLINLLDNAVKYSRERRVIRIAAAARDGAVAVSVADRGIGIRPEDRPRVFEQFVRLETGLVQEVRGAGLGLTLVDQIMKAHGGRVEVEGAPGEGSTFTLVLPVAAAHARA